MFIILNRSEKEKSIIQFKSESYIARAFIATQPNRYVLIVLAGNNSS